MLRHAYVTADLPVETKQPHLFCCLKQKPDEANALCGKKVAHGPDLLEVCAMRRFGWAIQGKIR